MTRRPDTLPHELSNAVTDRFVESLYGAFIMHAASTIVDIDVFEGSRSQVLAGSHGELARRYHTNTPRSGHAGLPMGWEMNVQRIRAKCSHPLDGYILEWADKTPVEFRLNNACRWNGLLGELLLGPQQAALRLVEHVPYSMIVRLEATPSFSRLHEAHLKPQTRQVQLDDVVVNVTRPGREILFWIFLDGIIKKVVC